MANGSAAAHVQAPGLDEIEQDSTRSNYMAEDNGYRSQRPIDPHRRPAGSGAAGQGGDPLAELARLIGQNDPFSDFARNNARPAEPQRPAQQDWNAGDAYPHAGARDQQPAAVPDGYRQPADYPDYGEPADPYAHAAPHGYDAHGYVSGRQADPRYAAQGYDDRYAPATGDPFAQTGQPAYAADPRSYDSYQRGMMPPPDEMYEDAPPERRRGLLVKGMVVLALVLTGTAGALGYRAIFSDPAPRVPPPVIKADTTPTKVVPATQASESGSGKLIYDRVGERAQPERIVSREEKPVDLQAAPPPRVVLSNGQNPIAPTPNALVPPNPQAFATAAAPAAASTEPKKIRTVTIRPDQPGAGEPAAQRAAPARAASAAVAADEAPVRNVPVAAPPPVRAAAPADPNAPLSLVPQSAARPVATTRVTSAPASPEGAYSVQVTSQRSEAEAQTAYRSLQSKFPEILGARQAFIRRADLGERGIYYRAQVGPFATSEQASELCSSLRAAGGQCVIQRN